MKRLERIRPLQIGALIGSVVQDLNEMRGQLSAKSLVTSVMIPQTYPKIELKGGLAPNLPWQIDINASANFSMF